MGDEFICTTPKRKNDRFIKFSVDDLVPILRASKVTSVCDDLECSMPLDSPPLPRLDVLGKRKVDTDLPFGEHLDTLLAGDREIDFNPIRDIEELERLLVDDPVPVPKVFDEPLGNSDSVPRSYDVTFSNPPFDFNDDYALCYDNPLFDEELEDISSLDPPESTPVIDESTSRKSPTKSLFDAGSSRISIFIVNTLVSLGCSGKYHNDIAYKDILRRILVNACKLDDVQQEFLNGRIPKET
ncbi:hypothetical protein Tco_0348865 [Tanacetum coccineum]